MLCNRAQSAYQQRPAGLMNLREKVVDISSLNRVKTQNTDLHVDEYARGAGNTLKIQSVLRMTVVVKPLPH